MMIALSAGRTAARITMAAARRTEMAETAGCRRPHARLAVAVALVALALALAGCIRRPDLDAYGQVRVRELQESGVCSHAGFVAPANGEGRAELVLCRNQPITLPIAMAAFNAEPAHAAALRLPWVRYYGYAQSDTPTREGWYYAVLVLDGAPQ